MWLGELLHERNKVEFDIIACLIFTNSLPSIRNIHRIACWGGRLLCSQPMLRPYDRTDVTVSVLPIVETSFRCYEFELLYQGTTFVRVTLVGWL
jgi:hypothetical protein